MPVTKTVSISRRTLLAAPAARFATAPEADRETWYVGEPIICVNSGFLDLADAPELAVGTVYTIAAIWPKRRGHYGLELREVDAKAIYVAFDERRFRPASSV